MTTIEYGTATSYMGVADEADEPQPNCMGRFPADIRLEMLVGHLADQLPTVVEIKALRMQANASVTTRGKLEHLIELTGSIWETLRYVREEAAKYASR
jgi:hypothetical protein